MTIAHRQGVAAELKKFYKATKSAVYILLVIASFFMAVLAVGLLKERMDKINELRLEYKKLDDKYSDAIKKYGDKCTLNDSSEYCKPYREANNSLNQTANQISMLRKIEVRGYSGNICGSMAAITTGSPGFEDDCYAYQKCLEKENDEIKCLSNNGEYQYNNISKHMVIYNSIASEFSYHYFDMLPSEVLYLLLSMTSCLIGGLCALKLRCGKISDVFWYYSKGFIVYIISTGAKDVVVFGNQSFVTNINPYSIALIGCFAGIYFDKLLNFKELKENIKPEEK